MKMPRQKKFRLICISPKAEFFISAENDGVRIVFDCKSESPKDAEGNCIICILQLPIRNNYKRRKKGYEMYFTRGGLCDKTLSAYKG